MTRILFVSYLNRNVSKAAIQQLYNTLHFFSHYFHVTYVNFETTNAFMDKELKNNGLYRNFQTYNIPTIKINKPYVDQVNRLFYSFFCFLLSKIFSYSHIYTRDFAFIYLISFIPKFFRPKCKIIFESHKIFHKTSKIVNIKKEMKAYGVVDRFVSTTYGCKKDLHELFNIGHSKILVAPNGVHIDLFQKNKKNNRSSILRSHGISSAKNIIVYSGSFASWKGVETLVKAAPLIKTDGIKVLLIGGSGDDYVTIHNLVMEKKISSIVHLTGYIDKQQLIDLLHCSDIGIVSNTVTEEGARYTSPIKLFEYMACGLPLIVSDLPAMREIVSENRNCLFYPPENEKMLAQKIDMLFSDRKIMQNMSERNLSDAKNFSWDAKAQKIKKFLQHM